MSQNSIKSIHFWSFCLFPTSNSRVQPDYILWMSDSNVKFEFWGQTIKTFCYIIKSLSGFLTRQSLGEFLFHLFRFFLLLSPFCLLLLLTSFYFDQTFHKSFQLGLAWFSLTQLGSAWLSLTQLGSAWLSLAQLGLGN